MRAGHAQIDSSFRAWTGVRGLKAQRLQPKWPQHRRKRTDEYEMSSNATWIIRWARWQQCWWERAERTAENNYVEVNVHGIIRRGLELGRGWVRAGGHDGVPVVIWAWILIAGPNQHPTRVGAKKGISHGACGAEKCRRTAVKAQFKIQEIQEYHWWISSESYRAASSAAPPTCVFESRAPRRPPASEQGARGRKARRFKGAGGRATGPSFLNRRVLIELRGPSMAE